MLIFETILGILLGAASLSLIARALHVPYPTLLALGGIVIAEIPGVHRLDFPPELILALFVAPVLLDAAHDISLRDLKRNWRPVLSLSVGAVILTTVAVAIAAHWFIPNIPWPAAIVLGALVAPPDAVAALAVLQQVDPPHKIRSVLEGESLLNDASSLLIYNLGVAAVASHGFSIADALPAFGLVIFGSVVAGWIFAQAIVRITVRIEDPPTSTIIQFISTFGVWIVAEHLKLSSVMTIVVYGVTLGRRTTISESAGVRISSFATWDTVTFVLNVLAFTLIGMQLRPIISNLEPNDLRQYFIFATIILGLVMFVRLAWVQLHGLIARAFEAVTNPTSTGSHTVQAALAVGWSGMRGIVTLAAALALPQSFPYRSFVLLTAFTVVVGTLVIQGLTLQPVLRWLRLPKDNPIKAELAVARGAALRAATDMLKQQDEPAAARLQREYESMLSHANEGRDPHDSRENTLRRKIVPLSRRAIADLRSLGEIGDEAYRQVEKELDLLELSARG